MSQTATLAVHIATDGSAVTVTPEGELDLSNTRELRAALWGLATDGVERRGVVLDLGRLEFIDTSGLHLVVDLVERCAAADVGLRVRRGGYAIQRAFEMSGLEPLVPFDER
jgi:anti-anti-sigma factor